MTSQPNLPGLGPAEVRRAAIVAASAAPGFAVTHVVARYLATFPRRAVQARACRKHIEARLREGYSAEEILEAVEGLLGHHWSRENGHDGLALCLRSAAQVDKYRAFLVADKARTEADAAWAYVMARMHGSAAPVTPGYQARVQATVAKIGGWTRLDNARATEVHGPIKAAFLAEWGRG